MTEGVKIDTRGRGPDLVMLHGWAMHSGIWGGLVDLLAEQFRVHLVDLPGHGVNCHTPLSRNLNDVADLILSELPPAVWMGWSLGGLVTLAAALRRPGKVRKAILVAATPCFSRASAWGCGVDANAQQAFSDGLEHDFEGSIEQFWLQCFGADLIDESLQRLGKTSVLDQLPCKNTMQAGLQLLYGSNLLSDLGSCEVPTLFVGGTRDRTIKPASYARAAELMPAADSRLIQAAGHAPFMSHQDRFMDIISEFYKGDLTT